MSRARADDTGRGQELSRTPPAVLREYALLADGERGVLVGPQGDFAFMCFPRWDSPAIFSSLIGGGGQFAVTPEGRFVWGGFYEERSLIWHSRWVLDDAVVECREALAVPPVEGRAVVLRRIMALDGTARMRVVFNPRADFGAVPFDGLHLGEDGVWSGRAGGVTVRLAGAADARAQADGRGGRALVMSLVLEAGAHHDLVLVLEGDTDGAAVPEAADAWAGTEATWRDRVPALERTVARRHAVHAFTVLSGLTGSSGGMVAAATMSLPERARHGRNYDYRYVWIRDQCFAGQAGARAGADQLVDDAVRFVAARVLEDGPGLRPAYTSCGGRVPDQRALDLPGYPGGADIVGNWVNEQFQLDVFGEALLLFAAAARRDRLDADGWRAVETAAEAIAARWREPDAGIWELEQRHWTHGRLICAAGLRAVATLPVAGARAAEWVGLADTIVAEVSAKAVHPSGRWQRAYDDARLDAALLLPGLRDALQAGDPRTVATLHAVDRELTQDGYAYRYRPDRRPLGEAEGAFLLCGFIMSLAWSRRGHAVAAARWFERNCAACGPPGLCSEEFDVAQHQLRGNLPQAFVHALLLECAAEQYEQEEREAD
jgi:alpha,alpha-trehalase